MMSSKASGARRTRATSLLCATGLAIMMAVELGPGTLRAQALEDAAQKAAESWLMLVDSGQYRESWDQAAMLFKAAITADRWTDAVAGARAPLGKLVSRKISSRQYVQKVPGGPEGKYMVLTFDTVFEKRSGAVETVTPMVDQDGRWRVAGYYVK